MYNYYYYLLSNGVYSAYFCFAMYLVANVAPKIFVSRAFTVKSGETFDIVLYANDSDGEAVTFHTSLVPDSEESVDANTHKYTLTLDRMMESYNLTFSAKVNSRLSMRYDVLSLM